MTNSTECVYKVRYSHKKSTENYTINLKTNMGLLISKCTAMVLQECASYRAYAAQLTTPSPSQAPRRRK